ncbi:MAG: helix-turn-helix domain-containing protein [Gemmataceae bacterium]
MAHPKGTPGLAAAADWNGIREQKSAGAALQRVQLAVARHGRVPASLMPLLLVGPTGSGKTALVDRFVQMLLSGTIVRTAQKIPANDLDVGAEEWPDLATCDVCIVEDMQHLPDNAVGAMAQLLDARGARRLATVLTANVGPAAMLQYPRRLTSRMVAGLVLTLDSPGLKSRIELVQKFAAFQQLPLCDEAAQWIAVQNPGSIRQLQGTIVTLKGSFPRRGKPLTESEVRQFLAPAERPTLVQIIARVAKQHQLKPKDLAGPARLKNVVRARQMAMYLARENAGYTLMAIGAAFRRDHRTVQHALSTMARALADDPALAAQLDTLGAEWDLAWQTKKSQVKSKPVPARRLRPAAASGTIA